jgi:hypothetical protein
VSIARFRVHGRFNRATSATVTINRDTGLITVRPLRKRRSYELPLSWAAEAVMWQVLKAEAAEKRAAKRARGRR